ncbi:MAG: Fe-S protein assembly chaperone HscA [Pseudomonadota bacterium]
MLLQIHEPGETPQPHSDFAAIGIDLGTTNSVVAIASNGGVTVLHDMCGGVLVPSVVYYGEEGEIKVGKSAHNMLKEGGRNVVSSIKRQMGLGRDEAKKTDFIYEPIEDKENILRFYVGKTLLSPIKVSSDILKHLKHVAESAIGKEVRQAVITVPAYFDDAARQATKDAARIAGLEVLRLINEPTAAALAYGIDKQAEGIYAIYDLGGGTFDISILKLEKGIFQVLATGGDISIGGDDFDREILKNTGWSEHNQQLLSKARKSKELLSEAEQAEIEHDGKKIIITRIEFNKIISPYINKTLEICKKALEDANILAKDIKGVVLVGGSTRTPYIKEKITELFGKTPLSDINPDEVVAVGAAIQAEGLTQGSDNLLLDVIPLSLGLETMGEITEKIIHRNTPIPVSVSQEFTTYQDGQTGMIIHVVQGEREIVSDNRSLARFELKGIPNLPAGIARVKINFAVDADGILSVSAKEENTGIEQSIIVKPTYGLGEEEIHKMLLDSMEHAKKDIILRLLREAEIEAKRAIEEIKSAINADGELLSEQEKNLIDKHTKLINEAILSGDRDKIDYERERLQKISQPFAERRMDKAIQSALKGSSIEKIY